MISTLRSLLKIFIIFWLIVFFFSNTVLLAEAAAVGNSSSIADLHMSIANLQFNLDHLIIELEVVQDRAAYLHLKLDYIDSFFRIFYYYEIIQLNGYENQIVWLKNAIVCTEQSIYILKWKLWRYYIYKSLKTIIAWVILFKIL